MVFNTCFRDESILSLSFSLMVIHLFVYFVKVRLFPIRSFFLEYKLSKPHPTPMWSNPSSQSLPERLLHFKLDSILSRYLSRPPSRKVQLPSRPRFWDSVLFRTTQTLCLFSDHTTLKSPPPLHTSPVPPVTPFQPSPKHSRPLVTPQNTHILR